MGLFLLAETLKGVLCGRLESSFSHSKSSSSIPRLAWGVIVQGFIKTVRMTLEIPRGFKVGNPQPQASCNWEPQFDITGPICIII